MKIWNPTSHTLPGWLGRLRSLPNRWRIALKDHAEARETARAQALGPSIRERQEALADFYLNYERLVELLCDAAQYGPGPKLDADYLALRGWMQSNYPHVRPFVVAYLQFETEDAEQSFAHEAKASDAFEALYAAPDLGQFLLRDDGMMISRIHRTRQALTLYADHLRQLAAGSRID